jgi:hypothetical protein
MVFGSSQPKPRAGRRKHIANGPQGAAGRGASKAKVDPPRILARCRAGFCSRISVIGGQGKAYS